MPQVSQKTKQTKGNRKSTDRYDEHYFRPPLGIYKPSLGHFVAAWNQILLVFLTTTKATEIYDAKGVPKSDIKLT